MADTQPERPDSRQRNIERDPARVDRRAGEATDVDRLAELVYQLMRAEARLDRVRGDRLRPERGPQ